jgi:hypothetical protein
MRVAKTMTASPRIPTPVASRDPAFDSIVTSTVPGLPR